MDIVQAHYAQPGLLERVHEALRLAGMDPDHLLQSELAKRDQFHAGGLYATDSLARLADIREGDRVLDVGSGIGGPSRHLAARFGCHVTGIDLTGEYCQVAEMLAQSTGLSHRVEYHQGNALGMPFADASFDLVWTQHTSMNIEDKAGLYREISRVLKPEGRLAIHDVLAGSGEARYPVPWASHPSFSFLITEQQMQTALADAGFKKITSAEVTREGMEALRTMAAGGAAPGFGVGTLLGPQFPTMAANLVANLQTGACRLIQAVFTK